MCVPEAGCTNDCVVKLELVQQLRIVYTDIKNTYYTPLFTTPNNNYCSKIFTEVVIELLYISKLPKMLMVLVD